MELSYAESSCWIGRQQKFREGTRIAGLLRPLTHFPKFVQIPQPNNIMPKVKSARKPNAALMKPVQPDDTLAKIVGSKPIPRSE